MAQFSDFDLLREARRRGMVLDNEEEILRNEARRRGLDIIGADQTSAPFPAQQNLSRTPQQPLPSPPTTVGGELLEVLKGLPRGAIGLLETAASGASAILPDKAETAVRRAISGAGETLRSPFEAAPGYEDTVGAKAGEALGSALPFFALGPLGVAGRAAALGLGVGAGAGEARLRAEQEGGMEQRGAATALGALVGATEVLPPFRFARRILNRVPDADQGVFLEYVKRAALAGGEEFAQEAAANVAQNLIAKGLYKPDQDIFEGSAEEGAYGFGVGAFIQGLTDLAMGRRVRSDVAPPGEEYERAGLGAEQTFAGAGTGGAELPVSRVGAERPYAEGFAPAGMDIPRDVTRRPAEGEEVLQPALEGARFQMSDDVPRPWYYSELKRQTENAPIKSAPAGQWLGTLKSKGVKDEEIEFTGLKDWLDTQEGNVSKEDVLNFVNQNGVQLDEVTFGGGQPYQVKRVHDGHGYLLQSFATREDAEEFIAGEVGEYIRDVDFDELMPTAIDTMAENYRNQYRIDFDESQATGDVGPAKYTGYRHPFGTNYREFVIRVPEIPRTKKEIERLESKFNELAEERRILKLKRDELVNQGQYGEFSQEAYDNLTNAINEIGPQRIALNNKIKDLADKSSFQEGHWGDYGKNAVAHFRASDMDGGKTFMVHEMQSQLAQTGRVRGFIGQDTEPKMLAILAETKDLENKSGEITDAINNLNVQISDNRNLLREFEYAVSNPVLDRMPYFYTDDEVAVPKLYNDIVGSQYSHKNEIALTAEFITDPEVIAAYESGQSPYQLFKNLSGEYIGLSDGSKYESATGFLSENNKGKIGDRVFVDDYASDLGTITGFYPLARGGEGVKVRWDTGQEAGYSLRDSQVRLRKVDSKNYEEALIESLLTKEQYNTLTQLAEQTETDRIAIESQEEAFRNSANLNPRTNGLMVEAERLRQERRNLDTKIEEMTETYDLNRYFNVPKFPFSASTDKWQNLLLKRILKYAVANGYERIMFPQGQEAKSYTMGDLRGQEYFYDVISPKNIRDIVTKYNGKVTFSKVPSPWTLEPKVKSAIEKELNAYPAVAEKFESRASRGFVTAKKRRDNVREELLNRIRTRDFNDFFIRFGLNSRGEEEGTVLQDTYGIGNLNTPEGEATMKALLDFNQAVLTYKRESKPSEIEAAAGTRTIIEITPEMRSKLYEPLPLFRMGRKPIRTPMSVTAAQKVVNDLSKGWSNKPNIKVVATYKDLPKPYRLEKYKNVRGMLLGNDVYIVAANAGSPSDVKSTLFHESLGHFGLKSLFRDRLDKTLDDIYKTNTATRAAADAWLKNHPGVYQGPDRVARAVEEVIVEKAEAGPIKEPGIRAAFNRLVAMIRKFLRGMNIQLNYTNNDITQIMREAAERVRSQPGPIFNTNASPRFQQRQYNQVLSGILKQNEKLPEWSQALGDGVVNAMSKMPEGLRRTQFKLYSLPQLAELMERYIPRIKAIDRNIGYRAAYTTGLMKTAAENHAIYVRTVRKDPKKYEAYKDVVNDINLFQVPVRDQSVIDLLSQNRAALSPQKQKFYDVAKKFYALPDSFQNTILSKDGTRGLFADYRKMGDKKFDIFAKTYGGKMGMGMVKELRERFQKERLPMYAPLVRGEGQHWLYYETTDGRQWKESFPNQAARERAIDLAIQEGRAKRDTIVRATRASELRDRGPPPSGFVGDIVSRLEESLKDMPEAQRRTIIDGVYDTFIQYLPSDMLRQELSSRQKFDIDGATQYGVLGFDQDVLAVYERTMPKMAYQLGNLRFALPLENAMKKVNEQAKLYEIAFRENNIPERLQGRKLMAPNTVYDGVEDLRQRLNFAYNPSYAWWVNASASANYLYSIAGNVSSALINMTVVPMMTIPSLAAQYGYAKTTGALTRATKMFAQGGVDDQGNFTFGTGATGEMKTFFDYLTRRGVIGITAEQELRQAQRASVAGYETMMDKVNYVMGYVFKNSERYNREVTLLTSFMLAREKGKGFREAAEEAIRLNNNINGTVMPEAASRFYQTNLGRIILTFRTFALTQIINISRAFGRALKIVDATPEERNLARKQLLGVYGMTYMVAGMKGLPLFSAAEVLASSLMGDEDEPYDLQQEVLDSMGELGLNGPINAMFGVDIASRTGFNGILWRDEPKRLAEIGFPLYAAERILGPTYGLVQSQLRGIERLSEGEIQRGFEAILPAPLRNPLKAARYATEGALTRNGLPIVEDVSAWNQAMQIFGFAPAELALTQEQIGATFAISDKLRSRRNALMTNLYTAVSAGDSDAVAEAYEAIDKFNTSNPSYMINSKSLRASYRERQRRAIEAVNGVYLPRNLREAADAYMADID